MTVELRLEDLQEIIVDDETPIAPPPRKFRWTPHGGITTKPAIRVGVMLGKSHA